MVAYFPSDTERHRPWTAAQHHGQHHDLLRQARRLRVPRRDPCALVVADVNSTIARVHQQGRDRCEVAADADVPCRGPVDSAWPGAQNHQQLAPGRSAGLLTSWT